LHQGTQAQVAQRAKQLHWPKSSCHPDVINNVPCY
jgi:hypothetical protein